MAIKSFTSDKEINAWRLQYPSIALTRRLFGNRDLAAQYRGEADKLLYQLKNQMQFQQLGQLKMTRLFVDGTVITAWSIFGQDFIDTNVRKTIVEVAPDIGIIIPQPKCSITLFNLPDVVQPMRYLGEIKTKEVEGIDYIKTYYTVDLDDCPGCILTWNMLSELNNLDTKEDWELYKFHNPFIFSDDSVSQWWDHVEDKEFYSYKNPRPDDHLIYNFEGVGAVEIIESGEDGGGTWIKWKAYTEYGYQYPWLSRLSRTGYGIMEIMPFVGTRTLAPIEPTNQSGRVVDDLMCYDKGRIIVDCCHKVSDLREVEMWWESQWGLTCANQPFILIGDTKMCRVPELMGLYYLYRVSWFGNSTINVLPTIFGGCPPFEWSLDGVGELIVPTHMGSTPTNSSAWYKAPADPNIYFQCRPVKISVEDRCGSRYEVVADCCRVDGALPMQIIYTSLIMGTDEQQILTAWSGCPPFTWVLSSGGGTLVPGSGEGGRSAVYTSPSSNPNCSMNPTITVTDCCGNSSQVSFAVNGWTGDQYSLDLTTCNNCNTCNPAGPEWQYIQREWHRKAWGCLGVLAYQCDSECHDVLVHKSVCPNPPFADCDTAECGCCDANCQGGVLYDCRTQAMKEGGCCPLNPLTGLPY